MLNPHGGTPYWSLGHVKNAQNAKIVKNHVFERILALHPERVKFFGFRPFGSLCFEVEKKQTGF